MANLSLNHIYKVYDNGVKAVNDFTMEIADREFIVLIGPSGCGKSTTLRMIAGLEEITAGELKIGETVVNAIEPKDRDIAMVFQNYALYPHMSVYDNMAFGLKIRKIPDIKRDENGNPVLDKDGREIKIMRHYTKEELDKRVREAAEILGITEYLERKPKAMSGGQRQRVALGRAIVREPKVFLLDEPLSNLDAKLLAAMRSEITKLYQKLQTTFVYVTHDQTEAMTMGTRIVVMKDGFIQQIDTPTNLYNYPCNKFVAGFIGTPQMNFFAGKLKGKGDSAVLTLDGTETSFEIPKNYLYKLNDGYVDGKPVTVGIRAEHVSVNPDAYPYKAKCSVSHVEELGIDCQVFADFNFDKTDSVAESDTRIIIKAPTGCKFKHGEIIEISLDLSHLQLFDAETEATILPRIPRQSLIPVKITAAAGKTVGSTLGTNVGLPAAIELPDGEYLMGIKPEGVSFGGDIAAKVEECEEIDGKYLLRLSVGSDVIFALSDTEKNAGETVKISVDPKTLAFYKDGECVHAPLSLLNKVGGNVSKRTVVFEREVKGKTKKVKDLAFSFETCGYRFDAPVDKVVKLVSGGGHDIFKKQLTFCFSPYEAKIADEGVECKVEKILDYGKEKFAKCLAGESVIYVALDGEPAADTVKIAPFADGLEIIETERDIRLV